MSGLGLDEALQRPDCLVKARSRHSPPNERLYSFNKKNPMKDESASDVCRLMLLLLLHRDGSGQMCMVEREVGGLHMMVRVILDLVQV